MKSNRTLIIGDIHGSLESLEGVLKIASYDPRQDRLICLGDYVDGWDKSFEVVELLIHYQKESPYDNVYLLGNHDQYLLEVLEDGMESFRDEKYTSEVNAAWWQQGGAATYHNYSAAAESKILTHKTEFLDKLLWYYEEDNVLFVHGGYIPRFGLHATIKMSKEELIWNRTMFEYALHNEPKNLNFGDYKSIFIGHTPTIQHGFDTPRRICNIINLDQGCKKTKRLTCWVLETGEWFQYVPK